MTSMHNAIPEEKLTEAYRLLLEMRDNCVKHEDDQYDDPKREAKYEALNIAMDVMGCSIPSSWISVEERLPEKHAGVIVRCEDGYMALMTYDGSHWNWNGRYEDSVTHWMPLPEPPKEE